MKLLISGIPGMGKTTIGNYLEKKHNFEHFDMELQHNIVAYNSNPEQFVSNLFKETKDCYYLGI